MRGGIRLLRRSLRRSVGSDLMALRERESDAAGSSMRVFGSDTQRFRTWAKWVGVGSDGVAPVEGLLIVGGVGMTGRESWVHFPSPGAQAAVRLGAHPQARQGREWDSVLPPLA